MKKIIFVLMIMLIACPLFAVDFIEDGTAWTQWNLERKTTYLAGFAHGAQMTVFIFHGNDYVTKEQADKVYDFIFPPSTSFDWLIDMVDKYYEADDFLSHPIPSALYIIFLNRSEKADLSPEELHQI